MEEQNKLALFEGKQIRKEWYNEQWYFSVLDIVEILTDSSNPTDYFKKIRKRDEELKIYVGTNCPQIEMKGKEGKKRKTIAANTEGVFRIVMSIPSPKAEPLRQWMAQVSRERIEETENPEIGFDRLKEIYKAKGYTDEWIDRRMQTIETRKQLTQEWKNRGVKEGQEYSILTATIAKGTFGLTPTEHKDLKGLAKPTENLRDHMTPLELILTAFGEEVTRQFAIKNEAEGFNENHEAAQRGGNEAGKARKNLEKQGLKVVSEENYLKQIEENSNIPKLDKPNEE